MSQPAWLWVTHPPTKPTCTPAVQVVSPAAGSAIGKLVNVDSLASVQRERYSRPTVLAAQAVGGEEDVPAVWGRFLTKAYL